MRNRQVREAEKRKTMRQVGSQPSELFRRWCHRVCVEFRFRSVSVVMFTVMTIRPVGKIAATIGLVVVITLVGFTFSLVHDSAPAGPGYRPGLQHSFATQTSLPNDHSLELGLLPQLGDSPVSWQRAIQANVVPPALSPVTGRLFGLTAAKTRKISLHLLDSILLI